MICIRIMVAAALVMMLAACDPAVPPAPKPAEKVPEISKLRREAEAGIADAQAELGRCYARGLGVEQDYREAARWYHLAAEQKHPAALTALGELCEAGRGVERDYTEAAKFYLAAADLGYAPAQYNIATLYGVGKGVAMDLAAALKWYRAAAEQGDPLAQYNLGMRYFEGRGVSTDLAEAYVWLSLAAKQEPDAAMALTRLKPQLNHEQTAVAQRRVAEFALKKDAAPVQTLPTSHN